MCIYRYMHTYIYLYIYICVYTCINIYIHTYIRLSRRPGADSPRRQRAQPSAGRGHRPGTQ